LPAHFFAFEQDESWEFEIMAPWIENSLIDVSFLTVRWKKPSDLVSFFSSKSCKCCLLKINIYEWIGIENSLVDVTLGVWNNILIIKMMTLTNQRKRAQWQNKILGSNGNKNNWS